MASDYKAIRADNKRRYGTDVGRYGPMLLANRYADRIHFIFELLQNAEDALARRSGWQGSRSVKFDLSGSALRASHFGQLFNDADVRGICGIAESTKDVTDIGHFGIGFKSVYAFTDRPEIHSGTDDFAIESFVWPVAAPSLPRDADETVILIPLKTSDKAAYDEIAIGLGQLGASALLFLRQIEEIRWNAQDGRSGLYLRESTEIDTGVRRVTVIGQESDNTETDEAWLVFSRPVTADDGLQAGHVEIAFSVTRNEKSGPDNIQSINRSPLVVFFPTVLEMHLGFLLQGPYRTTPSRDNVPRSDNWNQRLVCETASLLLEALRWLRDRDLLGTTVLECLPIDSTKFGEASMFAPLFEATKQALLSEPLLPSFQTGYVPAVQARLGRTKEVRELFTPAQLAALYGQPGELVWLTGDITQDRTPELRRYLMQELGITEVIPEIMISRLNKAFLEAQSDPWIVQLYSFLNGQPALRRGSLELPIIRLEDGTHTLAYLKGQAQAFLPGTIRTGFPTVRATICASDTAREFLQSLSLTEPDPVDDVIRNLLPKYQQNKISVNDANYEADIGRILTAFATDSKAQREKLVTALQQTTFVMAVDVGDGSKWYAIPRNAYLATERLKELFAGVAGLLLVHDGYACLHGEDIRELLEACGGTRYLQSVAPAESLDWEERHKLRVAAGCENWSTADPIQDRTLRGLDGLLALLPQLNSDARRHRAELLWDALGELEVRRGTGVFSGEYGWYYCRRRYSATFDAAFVRQLNEAAWVPDSNGGLQAPGFVLFDSLGWKPNPLLQSKIRFKPPIIETLAREAGIEVGVLDLLKKLGVTSAAELRARLGIIDEQTPIDNTDNIEDAVKKLLGDVPAPTPPAPHSSSAEPSGSTHQSGNGAHAGAGTEHGSGHGGGASDGHGGAETKGAGSTAGKRSPGGTGGRPFISYVAVSREDEEPDPDGLAQAARMALEAQAIDLVVSREPNWQRTPTRNPGYDLLEAGDDGNPTRWCEVKAMTGSLHDRPVGVSRAQFKHANTHGEAYWLYVVEHAGTDAARVVRIQDPAGKARTFTFDHGWLGVADVDSDEAED